MDMGDEFKKHFEGNPMEGLPGEFDCERIKDLLMIVMKNQTEINDQTKIYSAFYFFIKVVEKYLTESDDSIFTKKAEMAEVAALMDLVSLGFRGGIPKEMLDGIKNMKGNSGFPKSR